MTHGRLSRIAGLLAAVTLASACGGGEATTTQTTQAPLLRPACLVRTTADDFGRCIAEYKDKVDAALDTADLIAGAVDSERLELANERLKAFGDDLRRRNLDDVALADRIDELMRLQPWRQPRTDVIADLRTLRVPDDVANAASMRTALRALLALF